MTEVSQAETVPKQETKVNITEVPQPLDTYTAYIDRGPGWWFFNLMK